ncbi:hypothetical protein VPH35_015989 [Triticum aestivum]|uniref:Uncharacterized protein n=1 Tax=Aegilops tauschii subsp. strangulata TaxID=200361 RepID=A0A452ZEW3_AEGTS
MPCLWMYHKEPDPGDGADDLVPKSGDKMELKRVVAMCFCMFRPKVNTKMTIFPVRGLPVKKILHAVELASIDLNTTVAPGDIPATALECLFIALNFSERPTFISELRFGRCVRG